MLDPEVRKELRSLSKDTADLVARHLVMAGQLVDEDPTEALRHARAARALAGRVGAVREAAGLTAYLAGEWVDAISELRAARRINGRNDHLPVLADCERALGRPEKALAYADDPVVATLEQETRVELIIVVAGARQDLEQPDAAVLTLQEPARRTTAKRPWAVRLWYAYADALLAAGRTDEAREWFSRVADADAAGETDATDRLLELDGVVLDEVGEDELVAVDGLADPAAMAPPEGATRGELDDPVASEPSRPELADAAREVESGDAGDSPAAAFTAPFQEPADDLRLFD